MILWSFLMQSNKNAISYVLFLPFNDDRVLYDLNGMITKYLQYEKETPSLAGSCRSGTTAVPSKNSLLPPLRHTDTV